MTMKAGQSLDVLVISACGLLRAGVCSLLQRMPLIGSAAECSHADLSEQLGQSQFDLFIVDTDETQTNWEFILEQIQSTASGDPIVAITDSHASDHVRALYSAGVSAVVLKEQSAEELMAAVQTAAKGDVWLHRSALPSVLESREHTSWHSAEARKIASLTKRERDIIQTIGKGYRNKQIASELCLSEATVRHYLTSIFSKLGVSDRLELLIYAQQHGLHMPYSQNAAPVSARTR